MTEVVLRTCARHPDRPGAALCMSCRAVVCQECTTTWEGIHHCPKCLAAKARPAARRSSVGGWIAWLVACAILLVLAVELAVTTGTLLFGS